MILCSSTDESVMARLSDGDTEALAILVERYQNDIFRFCLHYLKDVEQAKELVQETFIRIYAARGRFDTNRRFRPWMLCIARNLCLNELKRKKTVPMESLESFATQSWQMPDGLDVRSRQDGPDHKLMDADRRRMLATVLDNLDGDSRELLKLRFFEELQAREIAEIIGTTEGAVRTRLHRLLKALREQYGDRQDDL